MWLVVTDVRVQLFQSLAEHTGESLAPSDRADLFKVFGPDARLTSCASERAVRGGRWLGVVRPADKVFRYSMSDLTGRSFQMREADDGTRNAER